ncbi:MAG: hypothetical protein R3E65_06215 [Steroidobacteraceae bacterium]
MVAVLRADDAQLPLREIVVRSIGMLLDHVEDPDRPPEQALLECPLVERGTTLPVGEHHA